MQASRGQKLAIPAANLSAGGNSVAVFSGVDSDHEGPTLTCELSGDGTTCSLVVPVTLPLSVYEVRLYADRLRVPLKNGIPDYDKLQAIPSVLVRVVREVSDSPVLTSVSPSCAYPSPVVCAKPNAPDVVELTLVGNNFSLAGEDNHILLGGSLASVCWRGTKCAPCSIVGTVRQGGRLIRLSGVPVAVYSGAVTVAVELDGIKTDNQTVAISWVQRSTPLVWAVVFALGLSLILWFVLRRSSGKEIAGQGLSHLSALLLDNETNTYSLSKFQFYLWTFVAVLAYAYLMLARILVQGKFGFAEIPGNFPSILLVSAGTTVFATGITVTKGAKAAGPIQPAWTDLLSVGGVVVPERMQFLVWTIVGAAAFLLMTLSIEPCSISELPAIPQSFLLLMGVSSAGYLGGKAARKPGPIIYSAAGTLESQPPQPAQPPPNPTNRLTIEVIGKNMSLEPGIRIGDTQINWKPKDEGVKVSLTVAEDEPDHSFAKRLILTIDDGALIDCILKMQEPLLAQTAPSPGAKPVKVTRKPKISVTNLDGQMAVWDFETQWKTS